MLTAQPAWGLAWNQKKGKYYLASQHLKTPAYSSQVEREFFSIKSKGASNIYKTYLEYGLNDKWTLITDISGATVSDVITLESSDGKSEFTHKYQQYEGRVGLSYQLLASDYKVLSAQLYYSPGRWLIGSKRSNYIESLESIALGAAAGISKPINDKTNLYTEVSYVNGLYYKRGRHSNEILMKLGLSFDQKTSLELGVSHKTSIANVKLSPYLNDYYEANAQNRTFRQNNLDLLFNVDNYQDANVLHFKLEYKLYKQHAIEFAAYHYLDSASGRSYFYGISYVLRK